MCRLTIRCDEEEICKSDGAQATEFEPFKGAISGALKRAGAVWGIGRYLYQLDAGFAECDKNTKRFPHYGKTKDGTVFSWKPPALPSWALPSGTKEKADAEAAAIADYDMKSALRGASRKGDAASKKKAAKKQQKEGKVQDPPIDETEHKGSDPDVLLTAAQNKTIHALRRDVGVSEEAYHQIILNDYTAEKTSDLLKWQAS